MGSPTDPKQKQAEEPTGKVPDGKSPEPKEPTQVPVEAIAAEREKKREAAERAERAEAEVARLKEQLAKAQPTQPSSDIEEVKKTLAEMKDVEYRRTLSASLGLDDKQTAIVAELGKTVPGLNPMELLSLAQTRNPDAFKGRGQPGFNPSVHGSMRPTPGASPEPQKSDHVQRLEAIKGEKDKVRKNDLTNNLIGGFAAAALGWEHRKIPIQ